MQVHVHNVFGVAIPEEMHLVTMIMSINVAALAVLVAFSFTESLKASESQSDQV